MGCTGLDWFYVSFARAMYFSKTSCMFVCVPVCVCAVGSKLVPF